MYMSGENVDTLELAEKPHKITGRKPESEIKRAAMLILEENGFSHGAIAKALDYHTKSVSRVLPKIRKESLAHPRKVKLASKCVEQVMTGFVGKKDESGQVVTDSRVKASDAMRAAELVYSRAEPAKQDAAGNVTQTFYQVNQTFINEVQADPGRVIDAEKLPDK